MSKVYGKFQVIERDGHSDIVRESTAHERKQTGRFLFTPDGLILVDEVLGQGHYAKACRKAKLLNERDNPTPEKVKLNRQLLAIVNKDSRWVSDDFYLSLSVKDMKAELQRLLKVNA